MSTQRLELTWIGKNHPDYDIANIEPRILIEDPSKSYGDPSSENQLPDLTTFNILAFQNNKLFNLHKLLTS